MTATALLRSEWTKITSVRSTTWSLVILVVTGIGLNALVTAITIANWNSISAATKATYAADPTGFLAAALNYAQIPLCVLGALVITGEFGTGMIRSSVLAVPGRTPMFAAKAVVFGTVAFAAGELLAFPSFLIAEAIIGHHLQLSIRDPQVLRAVIGVGLYLGLLGLCSYALGAIIRHTGAAITVIVGFVLVLSGLAQLLPGSAGKHIGAYLPANAGRMIMSAHQEADQLLSPWQGFGVFCLWTAVLLAVAAFLLKQRDI